jgi:hypothetical protein
LKPLKVLGSDAIFPERTTIVRLQMTGGAQ